jgi:rhodanese-related sulfurtransferase
MFFGIKEISVHELAEWMDDDARPLRIIDVRTPQEIARGTVPGAEAMPLHTLPMHAAQVEKEGPVVFVCRTGARSGQACAFMAQRGHDNVFNLRGGLMDWARNGLPTALARSA